MIQAIIFDVDGTLVDSVDLHAKAWQDAFADFDRQYSFQQLRAQIGKGGDQLLPEFLTKDEIDRFGKQLEDHRGKLFKSRYLPQVTPFPQVRALVTQLQQDGIRLALASSAKQDELAAYKKIAAIDDLIRAETTSDDAEKSKPEPDIFTAALQRLGDIDPASVCVIGDTPYDAQAATKAGLTTIGVLCGGWPAQDLTGAGCTLVLRDPADLLAAWRDGRLRR